MYTLKNTVGGEGEQEIRAIHPLGYIYTKHINGHVTMHVTLSTLKLCNDVKIKIILCSKVHQKK